MAPRKDPKSLAAFLATRGLWLILVELLVMSTAITFSPFGLAPLGGRTLIVLQVLWSIGASMIVLAGAQFLGRRVCLVLGAALCLGHNLLDMVWPTGHLFDTGPPLWVSLHSQMAYIIGPFEFVFAYPLLPWIGVMLLGFGAASLFESAPGRRNSKLLKIGLALITAFIMIRALDGYGDPHSWQAQRAGGSSLVISFLNTTKYPPSLLYLLMTLGPAAIVCALADRIHGWVKDTLVMFGRVPFAFYIAHFYVAHVFAVVIGVYQGFSVSQTSTLFVVYPKGFGVGLFGVYVVWLLVVASVYPLCRWMAAVKARSTSWWLSYL